MVSLSASPDDRTALQGKSVSDGVSHAQSDDANGEPAELVLLIAGDLIAITVQPEPAVLQGPGTKMRVRRHGYHAHWRGSSAVPCRGRPKGRQFAPHRVQTIDHDDVRLRLQERQMNSIDGVVRIQQGSRVRILCRPVPTGDEGDQATECQTGVDRLASWLDSRAIARLCSLEIDAANSDDPTTGAS